MVQGFLYLVPDYVRPPIPVLLRNGCNSRQDGNIQVVRRYIVIEFLFGMVLGGMLALYFGNKTVRARADSMFTKLLRSKDKGKSKGKKGKS